MLSLIDAMLETDEQPPKYKEGYLQKKEGDKKWEEYWVVLRGVYLIFYMHKSPLGEIVDKFCGCIELNVESKCITTKRKNYSFPFYLLTSKGKYLFKTSSNIERHQWFTAVDLAAKGKPPVENLGFLRPTEEINEAENNTNDEADTAKQYNENESESELLDNEDQEILHYGDPTPCMLINIQQADNDKTGIDFFKNYDDSLKINPSFEDDEMQAFDQGKLIERYREIYCNESRDSKEKEKKQHRMTEGDEKSRLVPSYGYPKPNSNHLSASEHEYITRLTKSANSLRGIPLNSSFDWKQYPENKSQKNCQVKAKSIFSRHLIGSAPEVKSLIPRSNLR